MNEILKALRLSSGKTVSELAKELGVSQPYLSQIENGIRKPSNELIGKYCKKFKVSKKMLLSFENVRNERHLRNAETLLMIVHWVCKKKYGLNNLGGIINDKE